MADANSTCLPFVSGPFSTPYQLSCGVPVIQENRTSLNTNHTTYVNVTAQFAECCAYSHSSAVTPYPNMGDQDNCWAYCNATDETHGKLLQSCLTGYTDSVVADGPPGIVACNIPSSGPLSKAAVSWSTMVLMLGLIGFMAGAGI